MMRTIFGALVLITAVVISACTQLVIPAQVAQAKEKVEVLEFDISEDANRFIFNQDIVYDDGYPADGSSFITRGYIYPAGTLDGASGVNPDGSPQFPDLVLGEWTCQGTMVNDAGHATTGVWVVSTQFLDVGDAPGADTIVTQGFELADVGQEIERVLVGGSGGFAGKGGTTSQTLLGFNDSEGVNVRIRVELSKK